MKKKKRFDTKAETSNFRINVFFFVHAYIIQKFAFEFKIKNVRSFHTLSNLARDTQTDDSGIRSTVVTKISRHKSGLPFYRAGERSESPQAGSLLT